MKDRRKIRQHDIDVAIKYLFDLQLRSSNNMLWKERDKKVGILRRALIQRKAIIEATPDQPPATPSEPAPLAQDVEEALKFIETEVRYDDSKIHGYARLELDTIRRALDELKVSRDQYKCQWEACRDQLLAEINAQAPLAQEVEEAMDYLENIRSAGLTEDILKCATTIRRALDAKDAKIVETKCLVSDVTVELQGRIDKLQVALEAKTSVPDEVVDLVTDYLDACDKTPEVCPDDEMAIRVKLQNWLDQRGDS